MNKSTKSICFKYWVVCYLKSRWYLIWKYTCTTLHWSNTWYHCQKYGYVFTCTPYIIQANSTHNRFWSSLIQPSNKEDMPHTQYEKHIGLKQWKEKHIPFNTLTWTRICCTWLRFSRNARTNNTSICRRWVGTRMNSLLGPCPTCHSTSPPVCPRRPSSVNWNC